MESSKLENIIMNIKAVVFFCLFGVSSFSHSALIVSIDDTDYSLTTIFSTIDEALPLLQEQMWWDDRDLAVDLASEAKMLYTLFAYEYYYLDPPFGWELSTIYYVGNGTGCCFANPDLQEAYQINYEYLGFDGTVIEREFAILSALPVTSPNTLWLFGFIVPLLHVLRRKRV
jgi:hypothetical protein